MNKDISSFETISTMYSVFSTIFCGRRILPPHPTALVYTSMTGGVGGSPGMELLLLNDFYHFSKPKFDAL